MAPRRGVIILVGYCHSAMIQRAQLSQMSVISSSAAMKSKKRRRRKTAPKWAAIGWGKVTKRKHKMVKRKKSANKTKKEKATAKTKRVVRKRVKKIWRRRMTCQQFSSLQLHLLQRCSHARLFQPAYYRHGFRIKFYYCNSMRTPVSDRLF